MCILCAEGDASSRGPWTVLTVRRLFVKVYDAYVQSLPQFAAFNNFCWEISRLYTFGCVAMGSAVLFILRSRLFLYSEGSRVNRVQAVLSGFNVRWLCFVQAETVCRYGWMHFLAALVLVDVMVM